MTLRPIQQRKFVNAVMQIFARMMTALGMLLFAWIIAEVVRRGVMSWNVAFFTQLPKPPGMSGGGVLHAIVGSMILIALATVTGAPLGILAGVYLSEYGRDSRFAAIVRLMVNTLAGIPTIIIGLFVFMVLVAPVQHFSGYAGAASLAMLMIPAIAHVTEDSLKRVPDSLREAALCMGASQGKMIVTILFRAAGRGLMAGSLLAVARVSGATAPLLFTALNSPYMAKSLSETTGNLTVTIFQYAMSPYPEWNQLAWGASLLILAVVFLLHIAAKLFGKEAPAT